MWSWEMRPLASSDVEGFQADVEPKAILSRMVQDHAFMRTCTFPTFVELALEQWSVVCWAHAWLSWFQGTYNFCLLPRGCRWLWFIDVNITWRERCECAVKFWPSQKWYRVFAWSMFMAVNVCCIRFSGIAFRFHGAHLLSAPASLVCRVPCLHRITFFFFFFKLFCSTFQGQLAHFGALIWAPGYISSNWVVCPAPLYCCIVNLHCAELGDRSKAKASTCFTSTKEASATFSGPTG